ncbi:hypothetical protein BJX66DRAFT_301855 [Aspergillus keveii]|uniref:F-box domain-containing protein n=1 Tax=Aspergillus keveii TaxID=714993 RepID=A0ABR4GA52_9EURO
MALSQSGIRPLTVLDLPNELLRNILDDFQDPVIEEGAVEWGQLGSYLNDDDRLENRRVIQNLRLVCRAFNELASPLLCPVLQADVNQKSLDRAVSVSNCPLVASGVRAICVGLHCFPVELASNLARFMEFRLEKLQEVERTHDYYHLEYIPDPEEDSDSEDDNGNEKDRGDNKGRKSDGDENDGGGDKEWSRWVALYKKAHSEYRRIATSWENYVQQARDGGPLEANDEYQEILRTGYQEFREKHREQRQLLESQSFVRTLASCLVRMPNTRAVGFRDHEDISEQDYGEPDLVLDQALLVRLMTIPVSWHGIERTKDLRHLTARILSELPIAIHDARVTLRELEVGIFPCVRDHNLVCPEPHSARLWAKLRTACQSLRRAGFGDGLRLGRLRYNHMNPEESRQIDEYVAALVSSRHLERVRIYGSAFGISDGLSREGEYNFSVALSGVNWPHIRRVSISYVGVTQTAAETLLTGLGNGCVESFSMGGWELADEEQEGGSGNGSWATAFDILRDKLVPQVKSVYYHECYGGEFGPRQVRADEGASDYVRSETPSIVNEVELYISGADMENPVRGIRA